MSADVIRHLRQRVGHARHEEAKAFDVWLNSKGEDYGIRESLWAEWSVARAALERSVDVLRAELADRRRLERGA